MRTTDLAASGSAAMRSAPAMRAKSSAADASSSGPMSMNRAPSVASPVRRHRVVTSTTVGRPG